MLKKRKQNNLFRFPKIRSVENCLKSIRSHACRGSDVSGKWKCSTNWLLNSSIVKKMCSTVRIAFNHNLKRREGRTMNWEKKKLWILCLMLRFSVTQVGKFHCHHIGSTQAANWACKNEEKGRENENALTDFLKVLRKVLQNYSQLPKRSRVNTR